MASPITTLYDDEGFEDAPALFDEVTGEESTMPTPALGLPPRSGASSGLSNKLSALGDLMMPKRDTVEAKRAMIMQAYNKLMEAQQYRGSPVKDAGELAFGNAILGAGPSVQDKLKGFGQGMVARASTLQGLQDAQQKSEIDMAGIAGKMAEADAGFDKEDTTNALDLFKTAATNDYRNDMLDMKQTLANMQSSRGVIKQLPGGNLVRVTSDGTATPINIPGVSVAGGGMEPSVAEPPVLDGLPDIAPEEDMTRDLTPSARGQLRIKGLQELNKSGEAARTATKDNYDLERFVKLNETNTTGGLTTGAYNPLKLSVRLSILDYLRCRRLQTE